MAYPLDVGGVDGYPVKVGSMLLTLVDPNRGFERAYNRWYERDHFYAGCLVGPFCLAGSRWVAPRRLKDLRWPHPADDGAPANPHDAGSYVAVYFVEKGHHDDFFGWGRKQVAALYGNGRGFAEREHVHTVLFDHVGAAYRDDDPVPIELALDAAFDAMVVAWFDATAEVAADLHAAVTTELLPDLLAGSPIEVASSWTPSAGQMGGAASAPMALGSPPGGPERLLQLFFVRGDIGDALTPLHAYTDAIEAAGLARTRLVAPFFRTVVGTDTYVDELW